MSDTSTKLELMLPVQGDAFKTLDVRTNFEKIDAAPGVHICTSATRPSWSDAKIGRKIYETNTGLEWVYVGGGSFRRTTGSGLLRNSGGGWAKADVGSGSWPYTTYAQHLQLLNVGVPDGARPILIEAQFGGMQSNPGGYVHVGLAFGTTNNSGIIEELRTGAAPAVVFGSGGYLSVLYEGGLAPGYYSWSLQYRASTGCTATIANAHMWASEM